MIDYMRRLRDRGLRMALCTNNVREWEPLWRAKLPELDHIFEVVVDSAFVGARKPEARIFEITLDRLGDGLRFEDCLLVDDIQVNCYGANHARDAHRALRGQRPGGRRDRGGARLAEDPHDHRAHGVAGPRRAHALVEAQALPGGPGAGGDKRMADGLFSSR